MNTSPYATQFTRTGEMDYSNRKPFRTKAQKVEARRTAWKDTRGVWHSNAPVSIHPPVKS